MLRWSLAVGLSVAVCELACAPGTNLRPASGLMPERDYEVGLGAANVSARPYVEEPSYNTGQLWFSTELGQHFLFSALSAFDDDAVLVGGALRWQAIKSGRLATGVELETGFLWLGVSLPVAVRVLDQAWLYTAPRLSNWGTDISPFLPLGLSVHVHDGFSLRAEGQLSWADFKYYNRRLHLALGGAYQW